MARVWLIVGGRTEQLFGVGGVMPIDSGRRCRRSACKLDGSVCVEASVLGVVCGDMCGVVVGTIRAVYG